jgi:hypothetical protein
MSTPNEWIRSFFLFNTFSFAYKGLNLGKLSTDPTVVGFFAQNLTVQILSPVRFSTASWMWKTNDPDLFFSA